MKKITPKMLEYITLFRANLWKPFEDYSHIVYEYIDYLKAEINKDPNNLVLYNQLAIMEIEASGNNSDCRDILINKVENISGIADKDDVAMTYSNIAYFYMDENDFEAAEEWLRKADALSIKHFETYYMLAYSLYMQGRFSEAAVEAHRALKFSDKYEVRYLDAVCAFFAGKTFDALDRLFKLCEELPYTDDTEHMRLGYAAIAAMSGNRRLAVKIADELIRKGSDFTSSAEVSAIIYFYCKEYIKCRQAYDASSAALRGQALMRYFSSCFKSGNVKAADDKLNATIADIEKSIRLLKRAELYDEDDGWEKDIDDVRSMYEKAKAGDVERTDPPIEIWLGCKYIHCPRHYDFGLEPIDYKSKIFV